MSENRVFKINPDLFKITGNTRKKKPSTGEPRIKVKVPKNKTIKNKQLLSFIRDHQARGEKKDTSPSPVAKIKTDFEETMEFMKQVAKTPPINATLKHRGVSREPTAQEVCPLPSIYNAGRNLPYGNLRTAPPKYGCLKGGKLPLYRNQTFRQRDNTMGVANPAIQISHPVPLNNTLAPASSLTHPVPLNNPLASASLVQNKQIIQAMTTKMENIALAKPYAGGLRKRKRTTLRRYQVGRPPGAQKISVLVSNRTIRNQISTKSQLLRQVPIQEVRKYLIKNGFIKAGSPATSDILRKMYECDVMMCGEIRNTNTNVLLHNYFDNS